MHFTISTCCFLGRSISSVLLTFITFAFLYCLIWYYTIWLHRCHFGHILPQNLTANMLCFNNKLHSYSNLGIPPEPKIYLPFYTFGLCNYFNHHSSFGTWKVKGAEVVDTHLNTAEQTHTCRHRFTSSKLPAPLGWVSLDWAHWKPDRPCLLFPYSTHYLISKSISTNWPLTSRPGFSLHVFCVCSPGLHPYLTASSCGFPPETNQYGWHRLLSAQAVFTASLL